MNKISTLLLIFLIGFPQISETIYTPALPSVSNHLNASESMVETTLSIYFLGFALGVLIWGMISDYIGRRKAMIIGLLIYGISTLTCGCVNSVEALIGWRFLQAFGASVGSIITQTMIRDRYEGAERSKLFATISGALAFSPAIGPLLGGFISEFFGWRTNFFALTLLAIFLLIWTLLSLPETLSKSRNSIIAPSRFHLFKEMIKSSQLWGHVLLIGATNSLLFGFYQEAPFVFIEQLDMQPSHYGLYGILIAMATIFAAHMNNRWRSIKSPDFMIRIGALLATSGGIFFSLIVLLDAFSLHLFSLLFTTFSLFCIFLGIGLIIPNSLSEALKPFQAYLGTAGSIFGGCYYFLITLGTGLMSYLHNGTALPLPLYMTMLGFLLLLGTQMITQPARIEKTV